MEIETNPRYELYLWLKNQFGIYWRELATLIFGLVVFVVLFKGLESGYYFTQQIREASNLDLNVASIISAILITYLTSKVLQLRQERLAILPQITSLTQKVHQFRTITNVLYHSWDFWAPGLKNYMQKEYPNLTYGEAFKLVFENEKSRDSKALQYPSDEKMGDTKDLYLQLRSFVDKQYTIDVTLYSEFEIPVFYTLDILQDWRDYGSASALCRFFNWHYHDYKGDFNFEKLRANERSIIEDSAMRIDAIRYKDIKTSPELLDMLGKQFHEEILPKLINLQHSIQGGFTRLVQFLLSTLVILIFSGVLYPILSNVLDLPIIGSIVSITMVLSVTFYLAISLRHVLVEELTIG